MSAIELLRQLSKDCKNPALREEADRLIEMAEAGYPMWTDIRLLIEEMDTK